MSSLPTNQVLSGNCVNVLKGFPDCCVDEVVTDPPYGIGFMGKDWDKALPSKEAFEQIFRVLKHGGLAFVMSSPRQDVLWRMMAMLEGVGFELKQSFVSWIYKSGFPKAYDVSKGIDKKLGKKRTKSPITYRKFEDITSGNFNRKDGNSSSTKTLYESYPESELAKQWDGWKSITGLKPALECILMVNKPFSEKSIVDNVLKHGVGAVNVDACRIPFTSEADKGDIDRFKGVPMLPPEKGYNKNKIVVDVNVGQKGGRFPANLLVSDGALDEVGRQDKGGGHFNKKVSMSTLYEGGFKDFEREVDTVLDNGGCASRYFDLDAWSRHHGFLDVPKASKSERDKGIKSADKELYRAGHGNQEEDDVTKRFRRVAKNFHPTVKPIKLMAYLVELGCPEGGLVLDPFCGSGTTLIAAHRLNRKWVGVEIDREYAEITRHRLSVLNQKLTAFLGEEMMCFSPKETQSYMDKI